MTRSRPTNVAEPSMEYIIKYSTRPSPSISPVNVFVTAARVSFGRSWPSLYGFSSQLLMANREFATFFIFLPRPGDRKEDVYAAGDVRAGARESSPPILNHLDDRLAFVT